MSELTEKPNAALKDLLFRMADDALIIGHRNSEWTGIGPILEEDIAFSSLAQDKVGQAYNLYQLLNKLGEAEPDRLAFGRGVDTFKSAQFVEYPIGEYDFSIVRHFFFDHAEQLRYDLLKNSSYAPLASLAKKFRGEIKYHVYHANTWIKQLAEGNEESRSRIQNSVNEAYPLAMSIFEPGSDEETLISEGIFVGEAELAEIWKARVLPILADLGISIPDVEKNPEVAFGGRKGKHTSFLAPLLEEMTEVNQIDPDAIW